LPAADAALAYVAFCVQVALPNKSRPNPGGYRASQRRGHVALLECSGRLGVSFHDSPSILQQGAPFSLQAPLTRWALVGEIIVGMIRPMTWTPWCCMLVAIAGWMNRQEQEATIYLSGGARIREAIAHQSRDATFSIRQGEWKPGCVSGFGIGNSGVPGARRPYSGEPVTNAGMRLLRAMITAAQPARLELTVLRAGKPGPQDVVIRWPVSGEVVFRGRTDGNGKLPGIALDGGQSYELTCGPVKIPLSIVSGTSIKRTVRLDKIIALAADAPRVRAGEPFTVRLTVSNLGTSAAPVKLTVHAEDATTATPERTIAPLEPGTSRTIDWPFVAGEPGRAYVLCFEPDGDRGAILDFTGPIPFQ